MKKSNILIILLLVISIFPLIQTVKAICDPGDSRCILAEQFGLDPSQIPKDREDIQQLYLQKEWTRLIEKNKFLGPIHQFFTKISWLFIILFHHPYEFSLTLFAIIVLWFLFGTQIAKMFEAGFGLKGIYAFGIGMLGAVILSWVPPNSAGIIEMITSALLDLIFKQENWWMRTIIVVVIIAVIVLEVRVSKSAEKYIKEQKVKNTQEESKEQVEEIKALGKEAKKH
ncbi:hypothetical protein J4233_03175 [Candidatus Pacearchaeota archaeon]|nr:hypothetical protein [Candidatus Pacearchaeota archaeon]